MGGNRKHTSDDITFSPCSQPLHSAVKIRVRLEASYTVLVPVLVLVLVLVLVE